MLLPQNVFFIYAISYLLNFVFNKGKSSEKLASNILHNTLNKTKHSVLLEKPVNLSRLYFAKFCIFI